MWDIEVDMLTKANSAFIHMVIKMVDTPRGSAETWIEYHQRIFRFARHLAAVHCPALPSIVILHNIHRWAGHIARMDFSQLCLRATLSHSARALAVNHMHGIQATTQGYSAIWDVPVQSWTDQYGESKAWWKERWWFEVATARQEWRASTDNFTQYWSKKFATKLARAVALASHNDLLTDSPTVPIFDYHELAETAKHLDTITNV